MIKINKVIQRVYKKIVSLPLYYFLGPGCRYVPTCSEYFVQAIDKYGIRKGTKMTISRLSTCHPYSKRDYYDPVI